MHALKNYGVTLTTPDGRVISGTRESITGSLAALYLCLQHQVDPDSVRRVHIRAVHSRDYQARLAL